MKNTSNGKAISIKYFIAILPIVMIVILSFFLLVRTKILSLSKERMALISEDYARDIFTWTEKVLKELNIYLDIIEAEGGPGEHTFEIISASAGTHEEFPYGIYWGDENGNYFDSSGWVPGADFVPSQRNWFLEGLESDRFSFGEPYLDEMTGVTCVSASVRRDYDGVVSVFAADVYLDYASNVINSITAEEIEEAFFITRQSRRVVVGSEADMAGRALCDENASELHRNINALLDSGFAGQAVVEGDKTYYVDIAEIENTGWYFVVCMSRNVMFRKLWRAEAIMAVIGVAAVAVLSVLIIRVSKKMIEADQMAKTDALTGLLNRDEFRRLGLKALEEKPDQGMMLIFDMDNFKQINDQLGHPEGDEVLKRFAELLYEYFNRNRDISARIGGDEFAVFLGRRIAQEDTGPMLAKFIELFHGAFDEKYRKQKLSVSIGAAFSADAGGDFNALYRRADEALYKAKQSGKNRFFV